MPKLNEEEEVVELDEDEEVLEDNTDLDEEEEETEDTTEDTVIGNDYIQAVNNGKQIIINFDKIFNITLDNNINIFSIAKKRNYTNIANLIVKDLIIFSERVDDFNVNYLNMKYILDSKFGNEEDYSIESFTNDLHMNLLTHKCITEVSKFVETSYTINLDKNSVTTKRSNQELQFTDIHAKIVLKASIMERLAIPLIMVYLAQFPVDNDENFILDIFNDIMLAFQPEGVNINNKLFKLIDSRIISKRYSDRVILHYLKNLSKDTSTFTREFYRNILGNIIPKIEHNKSIVSYLHAVIKNKISFEFTKNYPISFKPIDLDSSDSEGLSDFDKLEINMTRIDEGINILNKNNVKSTLSKFINDHKIIIVPEELEYYETNIKINRLQTRLMSLFYAKHMGYVDAVNYATKKEYILLLICLYKWLKSNNFNILASYLIAHTDVVNETRSFNRKQLIENITKSYEYNNLINKKYKFIANNLIKSSAIIKNIGVFKTNSFTRLPDYKEAEAGDTYDINNLLDYRIESIVLEYLNFLSLV